MSKTVPFQTMHFSISTQFSSVWPMDRTLSCTTTTGQSAPGIDGNKGVLRIPQSSSITGASASDCLVSYPGYSLEKFYPSAEKQSVYSAAPADWASPGSFGECGVITELEIELTYYKVLLQYVNHDALWTSSYN